MNWQIGRLRGLSSWHCGLVAGLVMPNTPVAVSNHKPVLGVHRKARIAFTIRPHSRTLLGLAHVPH